MRWTSAKIVGALVVVVVTIPLCGIGGAAWYIRGRGHRGERLGVGCDSSGECADAPCIHDVSGSYCSKLCDSDSDCPTPYVCDPTRSGRRHACMRGGVDTAFGGTRRRSR